MENTLLQDSIAFIKSKTTASPKIAIILGSGLGDFAEELRNKSTIPTADIPNYPISTVQGHAGKIHFGRLEKKEEQSSELVVFQGRVHFYETNNLERVIFPIRIASALGATILLVTNAAGGINKLFDAGTLMFIRDHINLTGETPLRRETRYVRSKELYSPFLLSQSKKVASEHQINTKEGVYCWTKGPSYETASEIRMMASIGADAVGMSTVPEVIAANDLGMDVLGISCITNMGTGISLDKLSHTEVTETANRVKNDFTTLVREIILDIGGTT